MGCFVTHISCLIQCSKLHPCLCPSSHEDILASVVPVLVNFQPSGQQGSERAWPCAHCAFLWGKMEERLAQSACSGGSQSHEEAGKWGGRVFHLGKCTT